MTLRKSDRDAMIAKIADAACSSVQEARDLYGDVLRMLVNALPVEEEPKLPGGMPLHWEAAKDPNIPPHMRKVDDNGNVYAESDGVHYLTTESPEPDVAAMALDAAIAIYGKDCVDPSHEEVEILTRWLSDNRHRFAAPAPCEMCGPHARARELGVVGKDSPCPRCGNLESGDPPKGSRLWRCEEELRKARARIVELEPAPAPAVVRDEAWWLSVTFEVYRAATGSNLSDSLLSAKLSDRSDRSALLLSVLRNRFAAAPAFDVDVFAARVQSLLRDRGYGPNHPALLHAADAVFTAAREMGIGRGGA